MHKSLQSLVDRHPSLRTSFHSSAHGPVQRIAGYHATALNIVSAGEDTDDSLLQSARVAYQVPFDLTQPSLFRATYYQRKDGTGLLLLTVHHLVFDGWSLWTALQELGQLYGADPAQKNIDLPAIQSDYRDYVDYQQALLSSPEGDRLWSFWQRTLAGEPPLLKLPSDKSRPAIVSFNGASEKISVGVELSKRVRQLAKQNGVTPYVLLLTVFQVLLYRYSGQSDLWIGTPTAGRDQRKFNATIGYFVNPIVIRASLEKGTRFVSQLASTRETVLAAMEHQAFPFPVIVERLRLKRDPSYSPLFQALFVLQKDQGSLGITSSLASGTAAPLGQWGGLSVEPVDFPQQEGQFDIELELLDGDAAFGGAFKYNTDVFDAESIRQLASSYLMLLQGAVDDASVEIDRMPLLSDAHKVGLVRPQIGNNQQSSLPLHRKFEHQVEQTPNAIALKLGDETLSYSELNARANSLAHFLIAQGVGPEVKVGISVERSLDMMVGILGVLKSGGAYVPIDPASPDERISFIVEDSAVPLLLTQQSISNRWPGSKAQIVNLDTDWSKVAEFGNANPDGAASVENLAYVIYTSGTTGKPKGVQVTHFNVLRLFESTRHWYGFNASDVWPLFHSFAFDVSVWEMWGALLHGGRLVIVPQNVTRASFEFVELVRREGVTVLNQTPSAFRIFMEAETRARLGQDSRLRYIIFAGEALDIQSLHPWLDYYGDVKPRLVNMYGITETTVHSTYRAITLDDLKSTRSMIGTPIPDLQIYLLDENRQLVPRGVTGEMYVGGSGVARGYLNRPELDQQRFLPDPFSADPGARMYKSGDAARYRADGDIEYLGRLDTQVKIRGFRIELGEIEAILGQHDGIQSAIVRVTEDSTGDKRLVAYYISSHETGPEISTLRAYLKSKLPAYMVPSFFVELDSLPLTANGKLDYRALPQPMGAQDQAGSAVRAPRDGIEQSLVVIWEKILKRKPIGIDQNFFEIGGHSLLAVSLIAQVEQCFGKLLPVSILFQSPTISQLAEVLRSEVEMVSDTPLVPINKEGSGLPVFCVAGGGGNVLYYYSLARAFDAGTPFYGLQSLGLDGRRTPLTRVEDMARECISAMVKIQPHGPYLLAGHCFGSWVALEIAQQLCRAGETVKWLAVIDAPAPNLALYERSLASKTLADYIVQFAGIVAESSGIEIPLHAEALAALKGDEEKLAHFGSVLRDAGLLPINSDMRQVRGLLDVFVANSSARYLPQSTVRVPIALFRAQEFHPDYDYSPADDPGHGMETSTLGWHAYADGAMSVHLAPGNHITMMASPNVELLAGMIERATRS